MSVRCASIALLAALTAATALARAQSVPAAAQPAADAADARPTLPPLDECRWIPQDKTPSGTAKVQVIALWEPWSSESTAQLPRVSRIAREHAAQGVTLVGITRESHGYTVERIEELVRRLGGRITFPIGIAPADLHGRLMALRGRDRAADVLVADSAGAVLAMCTSDEVEHVLNRIAAGSWHGWRDIDSIRHESRAMDALLKVSLADPALASMQLEEMMAMHPHRSRDFAARRMVILLRAGRTDEAASVMRASMDEWIRLQDAAELTALATIWMDSRLNSSRRELAMAAEAAEAAAAISGDLDPNPWLLLMNARLASGDLAGARAAGERAMAMGDERMRGRIAQILAKIPQQPQSGSDGAGQKPTSP